MQNWKGRVFISHHQLIFIEHLQGMWQWTSHLQGWALKAVSAKVKNAIDTLWNIHEMWPYFLLSSTYTYIIKWGACVSLNQQGVFTFNSHSLDNSWSSLWVLTISCHSVWKRWLLNTLYCYRTVRDQFIYRALIYSRENV